MISNEAWFDGLCRLCGSNVEEKSSDNQEHDYMNRCTNPECPEYRWHYCFDDEELPYYSHKR